MPLLLAALLFLSCAVSVEASACELGNNVGFCGDGGQVDGTWLTCGGSFPNCTTRPGPALIAAIVVPIILIICCCCWCCTCCPGAQYMQNRRDSVLVSLNSTNTNTNTNTNQNQNQQSMAMPPGYPQPPMGYMPPMQYGQPQMGYAQPPMQYAQPPMGYAQPPMGYAQPPVGQPAMGYALPSQPPGAAQPIQQLKQPLLSPEADSS